ncbi:MAG: hypothetical protein NTV86_08535 [Planctomycetota bacterium]|nr:hypothetical protein [Planctomycetota bacterium]
MPVVGFPDRDRHKLCHRCHKWHEEHEGTMVYPEARGPISGLFRAAAVIAGCEDKMRFICHRCRRVRRNIKLAIAIAILATGAAIVLAKWLGLITSM